jgi:hypothetical protein
MMDCDTPRGRVAIGYEREIAERAALVWASDVTMTGGGAATDVAPVDALFARHGRLEAVAEIKWRGGGDILSLAGLRQYGSYLITYRKLRHGRLAGRLLHVPYLLIVGLSDADVWWTISDADGAWREQPRVEWTVTQRTINGGVARRRNAYLALDNMQVIRRPAASQAGITAQDITW